jgi:deoxyribonuclease V
VQWPRDPEALAAEQERLGRLRPPPWNPEGRPATVGAAFVCFPRGAPLPGAADDRAWAAAVVLRRRTEVSSATAAGRAGGPYVPGLLALREGPALEAAVRRLEVIPEVLLVNATGRDHPRGAGLALHLGHVLDLPTIGVTDRPLVAEGAEPGSMRGDTAPLAVGAQIVGYRLRSRAGTRPIVVHAAWRTAPEVAVAVVRAGLRRARTPEALRRARRSARRARASGG